MKCEAIFWSEFKLKIVESLWKNIVKIVFGKTSYTVTLFLKPEELIKKGKVGLFNLNI